MTRNMVCFICPNSCLLSVREDGDGIRVENNRCPRGTEFAEKELRDPERTLTTTIRINNGTVPLASVRSAAPVKKKELKSLVKYFDGVTIDAPVSGGQVLFSAVGENGVNIIATRPVGKKN
jgi:CxxC motif-containing protein